MCDLRTGTGGGIFDRRLGKAVCFPLPSDEDIEAVLVGMRVVGGDLVVGLRSALNVDFVSRGIYKEMRRVKRRNDLVNLSFFLSLYLCRSLSFLPSELWRV